MPEHNMTNASEALKLFYLPVLQEQLNLATPLLSVMERDTSSVVGSEIVMGLKYGRSGGFGMRQDNGTMPNPNARKIKQAKWETKNMFATIEITDKTVKASRSRDGAFEALLENDLKDAQKDAQDQMSRMIFGDGTGVLATVASGVTSATIPVGNAMYLAPGLLVDVLTSDGATAKKQTVEVVSVDKFASQPTVTLAESVTVVAGDIITIQGNYGMELTGFGAVFTPNTSLYGIDRSVHKWMNPFLKDLEGGEISETAIQQAIDMVETESGSVTNFLQASHGVRRAYQDLQLSYKRTTNTMELKGGWKVLDYNGNPFAVDKYNPAGTLYGLDLDTWKFYHMGDWEWLSQGGSILSLKQGTAIWGATLARYGDFGVSKVAGNWKMTNIAEH